MSGGKFKEITWGKKVTHFNPCVLNMDMIASMTVWWWLLRAGSLRMDKREVMTTVWK
jgi:hypothetical protein